MAKGRAWFRPVLTLTLVSGLAAALIISPVGAAFTPTKAKIKKIAKKEATKVFNSKIGSASVANADKLDNLDSAEISKVDGKRRDWDSAGEIFGIDTTPVKVLQLNPTAATSGQLLINYQAWFFHTSGTTSEPIIWVELDQATDCVGTGGLQTPPGRLLGSVLSTEVNSTDFYDSLGGAVTAPIGAGAHKVVLCARERDGTGGIVDASLSAMFAQGGTTTVITTPGQTRGRADGSRVAGH